MENAFDGEKRGVRVLWPITAITVSLGDGEWGVAELLRALVRLGDMYGSSEEERRARISPAMAAAPPEPVLQEGESTSRPAGEGVNPRELCSPAWPGIQHGVIKPKRLTIARPHYRSSFFMHPLYACKDFSSRPVESQCGRD